MKSTVNIPWATTQYWGNEQNYVLDALGSTWISGGAYVDRLEKDFAQFCESNYAVATSNGTTAIHLAYLAIDLKPGDEVITPGFGFMAAANVAIHMGAKPVFCEVDPDTWCMSPSSVESCITPKTKAIIPIHTYGNVCDMDALMAIAKRHNLIVIEDAAEAIGSKYKGQIAGTIGDLGTYSFHATKTITTGEGGAVVTDNSAFAERMKLFRSHGMSSRRYWHDVPGHNFRLTNMQAALGCAQLEKIEMIRVERARVYSAYCNQLGDIKGISLQKITADVDPLVWAVAFKLDSQTFSISRDRVMKALAEKGIETRPGFYAASLMTHIYGQFDLPVCKEVSETIISLPSSPTVTNADIDYICDSLLSVLN